MAASFPESIKTFSTKSDGVDKVYASHVNDIQNEVAAIETQLVTSKLATLAAAPVGDQVLTSVGGVPTWANPDGWTPVSDSWAYASATTITVPSGAAARYKVGQGVRLTQTTVKYFYIVGVADTVLTITGGSDYTLANAAISAVSYTNTPGTAIGFPGSFNFATVPVGVTSPTYTSGGSFIMKGRDITFNGLVNLTGWTGNAGFLRFTLPVAGKTLGDPAGTNGIYNQLTTVNTGMHTATIDISSTSHCITMKLDYSTAISWDTFAAWGITDLKFTLVYVAA